MNLFLLSLAILVAGGALPLLTYRCFSVTKYVSAGITVGGSCLALFAIFTDAAGPAGLSWSWPWLRVFTLDFTVDSLSLFFLVPIFLICPLAAIYGCQYFTDNARSLRSAVNIFCTALLVASMGLVVAAGNMLSFALAWELMSISSFMLVLYDFEKKEARLAGYLYFLFSQAGALFIFAAFAIIFSYTGSFSFAGADSLPMPVKTAVFLLAFLGFGAKAGIMPLHIWLPHAHPAAPSHISALMSGVMIKMGIYGIIRVFFLLGDLDPAVGRTVLVCGIVSGVMGIAHALCKQNLKRLLAYSSVENIGIILIGAGLGMTGLALADMTMAVLGLAGCLLHVVNHSIFKSLLFFGAGAAIKKTGTGHIDDLGGLMKNMPVTGGTFLAGSLSIAGLPPFNGFISEFLIYFAAFQGLNHGLSTLFPAILAIISLAVIGGLASFCFTKVVGIVFLGEPRTGQAAKATEGGLAMTLPMAILAVACLIMGLFPEGFIRFAVLGLADGIDLHLLDWQQIRTIGKNLALGSRIFLGMFLMFLLLRALLYRGREVTHGPTWGCGFTRPTARIQYTGTSFARSIVNFFRPLVAVRETEVKLASIFPGWTAYDSRVEDLAEVFLQRGVTRPGLALFAKLRWIQHGNIQLYIGYIIVAILMLLAILFLGESR